MTALRTLTFACLLLLIGCGQEAQEDAFLFEPVSPSYHNVSSLDGIDLTLPMELQRMEEVTNIDFRVLLLDNISETISAEDYAAETMTLNEIGQANNGRGVLILFIEDQGVLKIEVSYELEGLFPDLYVGSLEEQAKTYFAGDFFGDFLTGILFAMSKRQISDPVESIVSIPERNNASGENWIGGRFLSGGAGIKADSFFRGKLKKNRGVVYLSPESRSLYEPDADPEVTVNKFLTSLQSGINDPFLPLLTEGSQYMRLEYPKSASFLRRYHQNSDSGYTLREQGDLAAAVFNNKGSMPVLLRKNHEGKWLVDVTKSWAFSQMNRDLTLCYPAFYDHPWMFALTDFTPKATIPPTPQPLPYPLDLKAHIETIEAQIEAEPHVAAHYFRLADVFYFECYWIRDAINLVEKGLEIDPIGDGYTERLIAMKYRFPDLSRLDKILARALEVDPGNKSLASSYKYLIKNQSGSEKRKTYPPD